ncbi:MAG: hypothetical protein ABI591_18835 [Kofleriaceae bacterium]
MRPRRRLPSEARSHQIYLKVEDAAAVVARATEHGATLANELHDWEYGERQATIDDVFGHQWIVSQTHDPWVEAGGDSIVFAAEHSLYRATWAR